MASCLTSEQLLRHLYLNLRDYAILTVDPQGLITSWNLGAELIFGYAPDDIIGQHVACLFTREDRDQGVPWQELRSAREWHRAADYRWHVRRGGALFWADGVTTVMPDADGGGEPAGYLKILRDVTTSKRAQDEIRRLATIDVLTGLANRAAFDARRAELISFAERGNQLLLLLLIDLDRFKQVNDELGHQAGDLLLQLVAQRMRSVCRESDFVARLGGDEFALMHLHAPSPASGGVLAEKLLAELARPFQIADHAVQISASIGIAVCPLDANLPESLLRKADLALYHAKQSGRNCYHFYTAELDRIAHRKNADHTEMRQLMHGHRCALAYQPIVDANSNTIAMEALLRLPGHLGQQPVEYAVGLAAEMGLLPQLGCWVTRQAFAQLRQWMDQGVHDLRVCVNTCAKELLDDSYLDQLDSALAEYGLRAGDIEIELTERDAIALEQNGSKIVDQLHARGFRLSLDDFGTGYSSLSYLRTLPVTTIKLDKSFLRDVPDNADANAVVRTVILLASELRLSVIAEGVESTAQADFLSDAGCGVFQGFLYARPLSAADATAWLQQRAV